VGLLAMSIAGKSGASKMLGVADIFVEMWSKNKASE